MAETLGSLVDKLSIKNLRFWHLEEALEGMDASDPKAAELRAKLDLVGRQRDGLLEEINGFFAAALQGKIKIRDEKVKLYDNKNVMPTDTVAQLGAAISELANRNIKLWHLEDEVRRTDLPDSQIVGFKRQIDATNQERNDLMDKVDEILETRVNHSRKSASRT